MYLGFFGYVRGIESHTSSYNADSNVSPASESNNNVILM
jgi:hypothetical protein